MHNATNDFLKKRQSTHNDVVCISVITVLQTLWAQHNPGMSPQEKSLDILCYDGPSETWEYEKKRAVMLSLDNSRENAYITLLSAEIMKQNDPELNAAWNYIQEQIAEPPDELDLITIENNGKSIQYCIPLKSALCLVYAALTDLNIFPQVHEKDQLDRLLTLFSCFKKRKNSPICHGGLRNDFTFTLSGVYPGVKLMVDKELFIQHMMSERLGLILENFRETDTSVYLEILYNEILGREERHAALKNAITQAIPGLKAEIINQFQEHGIPEESCISLIGKYLECFHMIDVPLGSSAIIHALAGILGSQTKKNDQSPQNLALFIIQNWICEHFDMKNAEHTQSALVFDKVNNTYQIFKQHQYMLSVRNHDSIADMLNRVSAFFASYYERCKEHGVPQMLAADEETLLGEFKSLCENYKKDAQIHDIENFFAKWNIAVEDSDGGQLIAFYTQLLDPIFQRKFQLSEEFLRDLEQITEINLTPYIINCFFLHAITVPPKKWSPLFSKYFTEIYEFVASNKFKENTDNRFRADALKENSYSEKLLEQLDYLRRGDQHQHYIPMLHLVTTVDDVINIRGWIDKEKQDSIFDSLDNTFYMDCIHEMDDLFSLAKILTSHKWDSFTKDLLGNACSKLKDMVSKYIPYLKQLKEILPPERWDSFMDSLDNAFLENMVKNGYSSKVTSLKQIKEILGQGRWMDSLDNAFLVSMIQKPDSLKKLKGLLPPGKWDSFVDWLPNDFLIRVWEDSVDRNALEQLLPPARWEDLLENICAKLFAEIKENQLSELIDDARYHRDYRFSTFKALFSEQRVNRFTAELLQSLDKNFWKETIKEHNNQSETFDACCHVLRTLSEEAYNSFLASLDNEYLKTLKPSCWGSIIKVLPPAQLKSFTNELNDVFLKSLIENDLGCLRSLKDILTPEKWNSFAKSLDDAFLKNFIELDIGCLRLLKDILTPEKWKSFAKSLDDACLADLINAAYYSDKAGGLQSPTFSFEDDCIWVMRWQYYSEVYHWQKEIVDSGNNAHLEFIQDREFVKSIRQIRLEKSVQKDESAASNYSLHCSFWNNPRDNKPQAIAPETETETKTAGASVTYNTG